MNCELSNVSDLLARLAGVAKRRQLLPIDGTLSAAPGIATR